MALSYFQLRIIHDYTTIQTLEMIKLRMGALRLASDHRDATHWAALYRGLRRGVGHFQSRRVPRFTFHNALERTFMQVSLGLLANLSLMCVNVPHKEFPR